jgi:predicted DNA-binding antitoxin AbrB/MazE fold protein
MELVYLRALSTIECVYEGGVLKPLKRVDFKEGERLYAENGEI